MTTENLQVQGAHMRKTVAASLVVGLFSVQAVAQTRQTAGAEENVGAAPEASYEYIIDSAGRILKIDHQNDLAAQQTRLRQLKEESLRRKLPREGATYTTLPPGNLNVDSETIAQTLKSSDRSSLGVDDSTVALPDAPIGRVSTKPATSAEITADPCEKEGDC